MHKDAEQLFSDSDRSFFGPMFISEELMNKQMQGRRFVSANNDTIIAFLNWSIEFLRNNQKRIAEWGKPNQYYIDQEPALIPLCDRGYNPWVAIMQIQGYQNSDDSVIHALDSIYRKELFDNYYTLGPK
ncbi:MAG TPA: hypothetical protein VL651_07775, partial [Bacteroidia bacterium]|nr:hypothetical protein [Bacteroidia bacterium]